MNLAKWIIVNNGKNPTGSGTIGFQGKGHDLNYLFSLAGIAVTQEETRLLSLLSTFVIWRGKYPVPLKKADRPTDHDLPIQATYDLAESVYQKADRAFRERIRVLHEQETAE